MNERARAIAILQKARDILMERLTERVIESGEEIVDEALGHSYGNEIESVYEQLGARLQNINTLLSQLPPAPHEVYESTPFEMPHQSETGTAADTGMERLQFDSSLEQLAEATGVQLIVAPLDNGETAPANDAAAAEPASFQRFVQQIMADDLAGAAGSLAELFDVDAERALKCAATFHQRLREQPDFLDKFLENAMRLRGELQAGSVNGALLLLGECFGLQGMESIGVMQTLKARLGQES